MDDPIFAQLCADLGHAEDLAAPPSLDQRLDELAGSLHAHLSDIERKHMNALKNLSDQVIALAEVATGVVHPALTDLASRSGGISEADVQAQADVVSKIIIGLKATVASALASADQKTGSTPAPAPAPAAPAPGPAAPAPAPAAPAMFVPQQSPIANPTGVPRGTAAVVLNPPPAPVAPTSPIPEDGGPKLAPGAPPTLDRG